jgi:hypothetical protein
VEIASWLVIGVRIETLCEEDRNAPIFLRGTHNFRRMGLIELLGCVPGATITEM